MMGSFNHHLYVDIVSHVHENAFHVMETNTGFQNVSLLNKMDVQRTCAILERFWADIYAGFSDYIHTDTE